MTRCAFVFPGQGSQYVGMGKDIYEFYSEAREVFDSADQILGMPLSRLCFEGPEEDLRLTSNTQPALFVASIACLRVIETRGIRPGVAAGHSVGEYAALVAAGALDFESALPLVRRRGEIMEAAGRSRPGAMAAVIGLDAESVRSACSRAEDGIVDVANYNSPEQVVISGEPAAVESASQYAKQAGAKRIVPLNVSGAFHSRLMSEAVQHLVAVLDTVTFRETEVPVVANATADYVALPAEIRKALERQIAGSVRWTESVQRMAGDGVSSFLEVGPGKVLAGLIKRTVAGVEVRSVGDSVSLQEFLADSAQ